MYCITQQDFLPNVIVKLSVEVQEQILGNVY